MQWPFLGGDNSGSIEPESTTPVMPTTGPPPTPTFGLWIGSKRTIDPWNNKTYWRWVDGVEMKNTNWRSGNQMSSSLIDLMLSKHHCSKLSGSGVVQRHLNLFVYKPNQFTWQCQSSVNQQQSDGTLYFCHVL